jgi:cytidylate kinase
MIVTIDGPSGAGKSSAARQLAQRLGFEFLDTGAMYRAVTLAGLRQGVNLGDERDLARLLEGLHLEMSGGRIVLNGEDITGQIRTQEVSEAASQIAARPVVRHHLAGLQRALAAGRNMVCEGRDQGTVVFPDAACKFFLIADPVERARRRLRELQARGQAISLEEVLRDQEVRDQRDAARDLAPMKPAPDAIILDSTALTLEQVVDRMVEEVRRASREAPGLSRQR